MIQFLLNQELKTERTHDPNMTVLTYLREQAHKPGTKEGCASGDCGACTVVVGELQTDATGEQQLRYRSLNSCLTFVASLHGKQLISVEDLKHQGRLHSVQQAMVECHGSQCGFCTPGFVMSLFALQKNSNQADAHQAHEALAGNLCRCTGYRPILAAAEQACGQREPDQFDQRQAQTIERLRAITPQQTGELNDGEKRCLIPLTVADLADLYDANPQARLLAGGTDLALEVTQFHKPLPVMIYVGHIEAMKRVERFEDRLEIGAATPLTDCYAALEAEYPDFGELLQRFASLQIRNQGTLGGNIGNASPIGDAPPLLIASARWRWKITSSITRSRRARKASSLKKSSCRLPMPVRCSRPIKSPSGWTTISPPSAPRSACRSATVSSKRRVLHSAAWLRFRNVHQPASRH